MLSRIEFAKQSAKARRVLEPALIAVLPLLVIWGMLSDDLARVFEATELPDGFARVLGFVVWLGVIILGGLILRRLAVRFLRVRGLVCDYCNAEIWPGDAKLLITSGICPKCGMDVYPDRKKEIGGGEYEN